MRMLQGIAAAAVCSAVLAGCASRPDSVSASYVSPFMYESLTCEQLSEEAQRVSARVQQLTGVQSKAAGRDAVMTGVALVVFWPAVFMVGGDDQNTAELARLKGEMEAIQQANIRKNCGLQFEAPPEPKKPKQPKMSRAG